MLLGAGSGAARATRCIAGRGRTPSASGSPGGSGIQEDDAGEGARGAQPRRRAPFRVFPRGHGTERRPSQTSSASQPATSPMMRMARSTAPSLRPIGTPTPGVRHPTRSDPARAPAVTATRPGAAPRRSGASRPVERLPDRGDQRAGEIGQRGLEGQQLEPIRSAGAPLGPGGILEPDHAAQAGTAPSSPVPSGGRLYGRSPAVRAARGVRRSSARTTFCI
jgi:hypothetical protein